METVICPRCNKDLTEATKKISKADALALHEYSHLQQDFSACLKALRGIRDAQNYDGSDEVACYAFIDKVDETIKGIEPVLNIYKEV